MKPYFVVYNKTNICTAIGFNELTDYLCKGYRVYAYTTDFDHLEILEYECDQVTGGPQQ